MRVPLPAARMTMSVLLIGFPLMLHAQDFNKAYVTVKVMATQVCHGEISRQKKGQLSHPF